MKKLLEKKIKPSSDFYYIALYLGEGCTVGTNCTATGSTCSVGNGCTNGTTC